MALEMNPNPLYELDSNGMPVYMDRIQQPAVYDAESQLLRGTMAFSKDRLRELDPSYTGYTQIFVLRMPPFMTAVANSQQIPNYEPDGINKAIMHCKNLKALIELGSTSYSGTPDLTMNTAEVNVGWSERSYPAPTFSQYDGKTFTIRCLETRGEPLRRAVEYYLAGISDPNVKATMLNGALNADKKTLMEPTLANYTFAIMVVQTDQTMLHIQDITIWNSCIITNFGRSNLDWENGTIDIVQPKDLAFTGVMLPDTNNSFVFEKAKKLLGTRLAYYRRFSEMSSEWIGADTWNTDGASAY